MMKPLSSSSNFLLYFFFFFLVFFRCIQSINAQNATTDPSEVRALNSIFQQWGIQAVDSWNISGEPCSGTALTQSSSVFEDPTNNPAIRCDCSFENNTLCHITSLIYTQQKPSLFVGSLICTDVVLVFVRRVYALDKRGAIPKELLDLPFLEFL
ncbi:hypothetical protein Goshw_025162 [Gossypium schwendimanii]|uniref:LRR receptor-like serine/threonine-protein kinase n=1 Tax=Gossypium schwendimanii TaxID=34291 RepID=A0A7J9N7D0_GOSSC|nr:hypothetical protein [Gossypium schwendimanii]